MGGEEEGISEQGGLLRAQPHDHPSDQRGPNGPLLSRNLAPLESSPGPCLTGLQPTAWVLAADGDVSQGVE